MAKVLVYDNPLFTIVMDEDEAAFVKRWANMNDLTEREAIADIFERGFIEQRASLPEGG